MAGGSVLYRCIKRCRLAPFLLTAEIESNIMYLIKEVARMEHKKLRLVWQFLKGSKRYFILTVLLKFRISDAE